MTTANNNNNTASTPATTIARRAIGRAYAPCGGQTGGTCDPSFPGLGEGWVCTTPYTFRFPKREDSLAVLVRVAK